VSETLTSLRRTSGRVARTLSERDRLIRAARDEGHSLRAIATAASLTAPGVAKILKR
jgi:hypothetical protein